MTVIFITLFFYYQILVLVKLLEDLLGSRTTRHSSLFFDITPSEIIKNKDFIFSIRLRTIF